MNVRARAMSDWGVLVAASLAWFCGRPRTVILHSASGQGQSSPDGDTAVTYRFPMSRGARRSA